MQSIRVREIFYRVRTRFRARVLEWEHASIKTLFGLILILNPDLINGPGFSAFPKLSGLIGIVMLITGITHLTALCVNGYVARPSALLRATAAVMNIILFSLISLGFLFSWRWSTALAVYPVIALYSLFSFRWAVVDVAIPHSHDAPPSSTIMSEEFIENGRRT